jgi:hypothetical protein
MSAPFEHAGLQRHEREIRSLSDRSGTSLAQVRTLFSHELARLEMGAKVGSYLGVLTASNVRGMLGRKARPTSDLGPARAYELVTSQSRAPEGELRQPVHSWEDDGGSAAH